MKKDTKSNKFTDKAEWDQKDYPHTLAASDKETSLYRLYK